MTKPLSFMKSPERDKYIICSSKLTLKNNILKSNSSTCRDFYITYPARLSKMPRLILAAVDFSSSSNFV